MGSPKKPDRVFHRIEVHRAAAKAYEASAGFDDRFSDETTRKARVLYGTYENARSGERKPRFLHSPAQISKEVVSTMRIIGGKSSIHKQQLERMKKLLAEFKADAKALQRAQDQSGYTKAREAFRRADLTERHAYNVLLRCKPATSLGIKAMAKYVANFESRNSINLPSDAAIIALRTIADAIAA